MKNLFKILIMLFISLNASCQTFPLKTPEFDCPNGAYLKDLDNVFPYWTGTWKGIVNNKEYTFQFVSFPRQLVSYPSSGNYHYEDQLKCKFKVIDLSNNQILYNDLLINNIENYKLHLASYRSIGYIFLYFDDRNHCNNVASFTLIKNLNNTNQVTYKAFEYEEYLRPSDCPYANQSDIPIFLPTSDLILTKQ
ncbi:DUF6705 family protein [Flavobacterium sp. UBA6195]|uniref:DUF6705 family protein n=1 Tax=Flavobacterium sp. UBA6195 TaxID=1946554 RepID=UPI0025C2C5E6|nr:hypothetical protein [Flavobacterium sp. UBA6195]